MVPTGAIEQTSKRPLFNSLIQSPQQYKQLPDGRWDLYIFPICKNVLEIKI